MLKPDSFALERSIQTDTGNLFLTEQLGKKMVVLFPCDGTSSSIKQAIQFFALEDAFAKLNTVVSGISNDRPERLAKFRLKHN